jgi:hypothetical protein
MARSAAPQQPRRRQDASRHCSGGFLVCFGRVFCLVALAQSSTGSSSPPPWAREGKGRNSRSLHELRRAARCFRFPCLHAKRLRRKDTGLSRTVRRHRRMGRVLLPASNSQTRNSRSPSGIHSCCSVSSIARTHDTVASRTPRPGTHRAQHDPIAARTPSPIEVNTIPSRRDRSHRGGTAFATDANAFSSMAPPLVVATWVRTRRGRARDPQ